MIESLFTNVRMFLVTTVTSALVAGCGASPTQSSTTEATGIPLVAQCTGQTVGVRARDGSLHFASGLTVEASAVHHGPAPVEIKSPACARPPTSTPATTELTPEMWAAQVGNCIYYGDEETSDDGDSVSMFGYGCDLGGGVWSVYEETTVTSSSKGH